MPRRTTKVVIVGGGGGVGASVEDNEPVDPLCTLVQRRTGLDRQWELSAEQAAGLGRAADYVRDAAASAAVRVTGLSAGDDADR